MSVGCPRRGRVRVEAGRSSRSLPRFLPGIAFCGVLQARRRGNVKSRLRVSFALGSEGKRRGASRARSRRGDKASCLRARRDSGSGGPLANLSFPECAIALSCVPAPHSCACRGRRMRRSRVRRLGRRRDLLSRHRGRGSLSADGGPSLVVLRIATWLILPVVICLSQRLSHACLSINSLYCETANGSLNQL